MKILNLSVHQVVDFLFRSGDIDDRVFNTATMLEGTRLHKYYQDRQGAKYTKEVYLKGQFFVGDYLLNIDGRCDGVIKENNKIYIEEIKTCNTSLEKFHEENFRWHLAQAEIYALIYSLDYDLDEINIVLTYLSQTKKDVLKKNFYYDFDDLKQNVYEYLYEYVRYLDIFELKRVERDESLKNLNFPFKELRNGQEILIKSIRKSIESKDSVFIEASTGSGKTISSLYGAIKEIKCNNIDKIFYTTPKNSGFSSAKKAMNIFLNNGVKLITTEVIAKEKMCINKNKKRKCNIDECPFAKDYYTKLKDILKEALGGDDYIFDERTIKAIARKNQICPFELSLDLTNYSDVIICDYNYIFDPIASFKRYFLNPDKEYRKLLLVDESHNLIDRGTNMFTASLSVSSFLNSLKTLSKIKNKKIMKIVDNLKEYFINIDNFDFGEKNNYILEDFEEGFIEKLKHYDIEIKEYLRKHKRTKFEKLDDFNREIYRFILIYDTYEENKDKYKLFISKDKEDVVVCIYCLDFSSLIKNRVFTFIGSVFFSATLSPLNYYTNRILGRDNCLTYTIPSPFKKENFKVLLDPYTSLLYKDRLLTLEKVKKEIEIFVTSKVGNYMIFAPSFEYLNLLKNSLKIDGINIFYQDKNMLSESKEEFLDNFIENTLITNVGVCVLGGSFSEGIDLVGDRLIGVVVIGIGLPTVSFENNLKKDYFDSLGLNGYEYSYLNVGLNKVTQAVGRVIRTKDDKGMVLLIDKRFKYKTYEDLFLNAWSNYKVIKKADDIKEEVEKFYNISK